MKASKEARIARAEARRRAPKAGKAHLISLRTTEEAALDSYGGEKIGKDDLVIFLVGVTPPPRPDDEMPPHRNSP